MSDCIRNAIVYLTYNGIYNFTNGIGTQCQLLLSGIEQASNTITQEFGPLDVHVACPMPDGQTWGFDESFFRRQRERIASLGGSLHLVPYKEREDQELWDLRSWRTLSKSVVPWLQKLYRQYDRCLAICVDQPWLLAPSFLKYHNRTHVKQPFLLALYNTAFIRNMNAPDAGEIAWEQQALSQSNHWDDVFIADICPSFTHHLKESFQRPIIRLAPYTSSILSTDVDFAPLAQTTVRAILERYHIPLHIPLILAFGRATPIKGFDLLIAGLQGLHKQCHLVLISVPYLDEHDEQHRYDALLAEQHISATHIKHFNRELPKALCQWPGTRAVVVPSRQETFSNIPLEVALWAQRQGPVVITSDIGGFVDIIEDNQTGFLFQSESCQSLHQTLQRVLRLRPQSVASIRQNLYQHVRQEHDFKHPFPRTLRWFWSGDN
jgi:glycosyltransferase involved in cell wall biosynthesis